jgi:hypothetical protein
MTRPERDAILATCAPFAALVVLTPWMDSPLATALLLCLAVPALLITGMAIATPTTTPTKEEPTDGYF